MKKLCFILLFLLIGIFHAQTYTIPQNIQSAFEGVWIYEVKYHTNSVAIRFEKGKDYAIFTDIGTGEAPPKSMKAIVKGNLLIIPAQQNQNDYIEAEIIKGKLHLKIKQVTWDKKGNAIQNSNSSEQRIFKRIAKKDNTRSRRFRTE